MSLRVNVVPALPGPGTNCTVVVITAVVTFWMVRVLFDSPLALLRLRTTSGTYCERLTFNVL